MKTQFVSALVFAALFASYACPGAQAGHESGGGDPRVAEFLTAAKTACDWIGKNPELSQYGAECATERSDLENSLNNVNQVAEISSTAQDVRDQNGVLKDAVTDLKTRTILINIARWESESDQEHVATAAMEMALLVGIPDRYDLGEMLTADASNAKTSEGIQDGMYRLLDAPYGYECTMELQLSSDSKTLQLVEFPQAYKLPGTVFTHTCLGLNLRLTRQSDGSYTDAQGIYAVRQFNGNEVQMGGYPWIKVE